MEIIKGRIFSDKAWYYFQARTDKPFHYLKLVVWIFARFLQLMSMGLASLKTAAKQKETKYNFKSSSLREWFGIFFEPNQIFLKKSNLIRLCKVFIIKMWLYKGISLIVICSETIGNTLGTQAKIRTLYNAILRTPRNFLETRENVKILTHPFYHINLSWFSWEWSKNFFGFIPIKINPNLYGRMDGSKF